MTLMEKHRFTFTPTRSLWGHFRQVTISLWGHFRQVTISPAKLRMTTKLSVWRL